MAEIWHKAPKNQSHSAVAQSVQFINSTQRTWRTKQIEWLRMYGGLDALSTYGTSTFDRISAVNTEFKYTWNVIFSIIDTLVSKLGKAKPRIRAVPSGADFSTYTKAKKLTKYLDGQIYSLDLYEINREVMRDANIFGTGVLKIYHDGKNIKAERILPFDVLVDNMDGLYGKPQQIFHRRPVSKDLLSELYPTHQGAIAASSSESSFLNRNLLSNFCDVTDAWIIATENTPGRYVRCIDSVTLEDMPYESTNLPFLFFRSKKRPLGFWGQGIAERQEGAQLAINKNLFRIQRSLNLLGVPWVMVGQDTDIPDDHFQNRIGIIMRYSRNKPTVEVHPTTHPEVFNWNASIYQKAFEIEGVSLLSAASKLPAGVTAAVAIREVSDVESDRFMEVGQDWEDFYMKIAERLLEVAKDLSETSNISVSYRNKVRDIFETIDWSDVDLEKDKYILQLQKSNLLPTRLEGRKQFVIEMLDAGILDKTQALEQLDLPDLERYQDLENAKQNNLRLIIDKILDEGEYNPPEVLDGDLNFAMSYAVKVYSDAKYKGYYPEEHLDLLRQYINEVAELMKSLEPPPAPAPQ